MYGPCVGVYECALHPRTHTLNQLLSPAIRCALPGVQGGQAQLIALDGPHSDPVRPGRYY